MHITNFSRSQIYQIQLNIFLKVFVIYKLQIKSYLLIHQNK